MSHLLVMTLHAALVGIFFAFLTREGKQERARMFVTIFAGMLIGALALAWLMYPYPLQGTP
ncbi:MAG: hypothetical protein ACE5IK_13850 [Acidobacteriota bacterium]